MAAIRPNILSLIHILDAIERGALDLSDFGSAAEDAAGSVTTTFEATLDPIDKATVAFNNLKLVGADQMCIRDRRK